MQRLCRERSCSYPGVRSTASNAKAWSRSWAFCGARRRNEKVCPALRPPMVGALHAVMHEVTGQKSADGIVVDSFDEAKA